MLSALALSVVISATEPSPPVLIETSEILIEMTPRSPNQMRSFYEARGFPKSMLDEMKGYCFITTGITNKTNRKIWLDIANWQYSVNGKPVIRKTKGEWKQRWVEMGLAKSKQSTFRWTMIPETLDYLPGEKEGGNVTLEFVPDYFHFEASFKTGDDQQGSVIKVSTDKLYCAEDPIE